MTEFVRSNQEQAVASWVNYLNQLRIDELLSSLRHQDENLLKALGSIDEAIRKIELEVVTANRGGLRGMHGFIAEIAEVGIGNARKLILGQESVYQWVNDNGPVDLLRNGIDIQQKFVSAGGRFSLGAIAEHLQKYPDYVLNGGKYQIPGDHFEVIQKLYSMPPEEAGELLSRSGSGPSFKDWQRIESFFRDGSIGIESLEPSTLKYREVQRNVYKSTMAAEQESLLSTDQSLRDTSYQESRPDLQEAATVTLTAAAIEGGTAFMLAVVAKLRQGKRLRDFSEQDWLNIAGETGFGTIKGGARGISVYALTNFTATSAAVASSIVTATFGIAEQANKLRRGEIDEQKFIENSQLVSLEAAVSALSSFVGQAFIPVPVLGAIIGNTVGILIYRALSSSLSRREAELIERYFLEQQVLDEQLAIEYQELIVTLEQGMAAYLGLVERAFSPDVEIALIGSGALARGLGVSADEILDSSEKILAYFLD
ncbi:hypothetical protein [Pseudarthrobacter sp. MEB009]|uniref:hypothetical protein n=1 Tax=Pseudarthrobacter sp. MEB009 TaxID=3040326 RepID=UPI002555C66B|nr:hypothetical protein [Pseudarthrobacter sp. MEB009]